MVTTESSTSPAFRWIAGHVALDFANTIAWTRSDGPDDALPQYERLTSYARLVDWSLRAGLVDGRMAGSLLQRAASAPAAADVALDRATSLREAIHQIFAARAREEAVPAEMLATLNAVLREGGGRRSLVDTAQGFSFCWLGAETALDSPLWPLSAAAAELLASPSLSQVRQCAANPCGFLFLDTSHGGRRRWCDMADCGNRAKARRHRARAADRGIRR